MTLLRTSHCLDFAPRANGQVEITHRRGGKRYLVGRAVGDLLANWRAPQSRQDGLSRLPAGLSALEAELRDRLKVKPGLTGLWQVEARDNPSFDAYRRLDLYYVENWSVSLDLIILLATVEQVVARLVSSLFSRHAHTEGAAVPMS